MAAYHVSQHSSSIAPSKPEAIALKQMDILKVKTPTQPIPNTSLVTPENEAQPQAPSWSALQKR